MKKKQQSKTKKKLTEFQVLKNLKLMYLSSLIEVEKKEEEEKNAF